MWSLAPLIGLPLLALLAGWYKFQAWRWDLLALGLGLALLVWLFGRAVARLAPEQAPALVWGSLLGGAAWGLLLALLTPFSGLTWVLVAPFHHEAMFVALALMGVASLLRGPWAGRWPRAGGGQQSLPKAWRLLIFLGLGGLLLLAALHVGLQAALLEAGGQAAPGGLKGLAKSPAAVLWLLGLGGLGLAAVLARWPGRALTQWLPALGFGLLWARVGLSVASAMEPVQRAFSAEILQLLFLAAATWLGLCLTKAQRPA
ncbi:MAG: hypothetical protein HY910_13410 [Desulfarculus sp.]|nr:hypothetical protein [Desulfarculus sp.]